MVLNKTFGIGQNCDTKTLLKRFLNMLQYTVGMQPANLMKNFVKSRNSMKFIKSLQKYALMLNTEVN